MRPSNIDETKLVDVKGSANTEELADGKESVNAKKSVDAERALSAEDLAGVEEFVIIFANINTRTNSILLHALNMHLE